MGLDLKQLREEVYSFAAGGENGCLSCRRTGRSIEVWLEDIRPIFLRHGLDHSVVVAAAALTPNADRRGGSAVTVRRGLVVGSGCVLPRDFMIAVEKVVADQ